MTLKAIMQLKEGDSFLYKGKPATVKSTYYLVEFEGTTQAGKEMWSRNYMMHFQPQNISLCSCCPWAAIVEMPDYEKVIL